MDVDEILEGLTQEERLNLLERLVKESAQKEEKLEDLSLEERLKRLEDFQRSFGPRWAFRRHFFWGHHRGHWCPGWVDYQ